MDRMVSVESGCTSDSWDEYDDYDYYGNDDEVSESINPRKESRFYFQNV